MFILALLLILCCTGAAQATEDIHAGTVVVGACQPVTVTDPQPFIGNAGEVFVTTDKAGAIKVWKVDKGQTNYFYEYQPEAMLCDRTLTLRGSDVILILIKE